MNAIPGVPPFPGAVLHHGEHLDPRVVTNRRGTVNAPRVGATHAACPPVREPSCGLCGPTHAWRHRYPGRGRRPTPTHSPRRMRRRLGRDQRGPGQFRSTHAAGTEAVETPYERAGTGADHPACVACWTGQGNQPLDLCECQWSRGLDPIARATPAATPSRKEEEAPMSFKTQTRGPASEPRRFVANERWK